MIQASPGLAPKPGSTPIVEPTQRLWAGQLTTTLNRSLHLAGKVTDSQGHPIAPPEWIHARHSDLERTIQTSDDGHFRWENLNQGPFAFTVLAPGHGPRQIQVQSWAGCSTRNPVNPSRSSRPSPRIGERSGGGVEIQLIEYTDHIMLGRGSLVQRGGTTSCATTDSDGQFRFSPEAAGAWLVATGEAGFALAKPPAPRDPATLQLQAWGRIEGRIELADRARPDQSVWLDPGPTFTSPLITMITSKAEPDSEGRFVFDSVRPAEYAISLRIADAPPGHHRTPTIVERGRTTEVRIAHPGPRIQGRLVLQPAQVAPKDDKVFAVTFEKPGLPRFDFTQLAGPPSPEELTRRAAEMRRIQLLRSSIVAAFPDADGRFITP